MDTNKKILDSCCPEFGNELISVVPLAYYLHTREELKKVITAKDMSPFYYFTDCEEIYEKRMNKMIVGRPRDAETKEVLGKKGSPYIWEIPQGKKYPEEWIPPSYKKHYGNNDIFNFDKPLCIITSKYSKEFGGRDPVNYFGLDVLKEMIEHLKDRYTIIYNRQTPDIGTVDPGQPILDFGDFDLIKKYKEVILIQDLIKKFNMTYSEVTVNLYSKCDKFISVLGGPAVLGSYFGGINIILAVWGVEFRYGSFPYYHLFSDCEIVIVKKNIQLLEAIKSY